MEMRKATRLDRALCYVEWRRMFPLATVRYLTHSHSDHCPLLLDLKGRRLRRLGDMPFKFQTAWLRHREFAGWLGKEWVYDGNLIELLRGFSDKLLA